MRRPVTTLCRNGHTAIGVVQLLTLGGCEIWALIGFILIIVGSFKDSNGRLLVKR